jgi:hypothetical protein
MMKVVMRGVMGVGMSRGFEKGSITNGRLALLFKVDVNSVRTHVVFGVLGSITVESHIAY